MGKHGRHRPPLPASQAGHGAPVAPLNEEDALAQQNAPYRGVQREFMIFRAILPHFPALPPMSCVRLRRRLYLREWSGTVGGERWPDKLTERPRG